MGPGTAQVSIPMEQPRDASPCQQKRGGKPFTAAPGRDGVGPSGSALVLIVVTHTRKHRSWDQAPRSWASPQMLWLSAADGQLGLSPEFSVNSPGKSSNLGWSGNRPTPSTVLKIHEFLRRLKRRKPHRMTSSRHLGRKATHCFRDQLGTETMRPPSREGPLLRAVNG